MANRSLRRPNSGVSRTPVIIAEPTRKPVGTVILEPVAKPNTDRSAKSDDTDVAGISDEPIKHRVTEFDPADTTSDATGDGNGSGDGKRTRRRRSDSGQRRTRKGRKEAPQNIEAVAGMIHTWASVLLKTPEIALDEDELKQLSHAYDNFSEHHEVPILTPKRMSEIQLVSTLLMMYGTRFIAISNRKRAERNAQKLRVMPGQVAAK